MDRKYTTAVDSDGQFRVRQIGLISACGLLTAFALATFSHQNPANPHQLHNMSVFEIGLSSDAGSSALRNR